MTPFDWNTFWIVTREALPLASRMVSAWPLNSTVSSSPSTVLNLALPPPLLDASHKSLTERRQGTTWELITAVSFSFLCRVHRAFRHAARHYLKRVLLGGEGLRAAPRRGYWSGRRR